MAGNGKVPSFGQIYANSSFQKDYTKKNGSALMAENSAGGGAAAAGNAMPQSSTVNGGQENGTSAYDRLMSVYSAALDAQRAQRRAAYDAAVQEQRQQYEQNVNKVNSAADKALREAYINKMQTQRTLGQQMAAQGLNGGYSETTAAGLQNNYGNARNELETERSSQLNDLNMTYQKNLAAARNILDSGNAGDYSAYLSDVAKLIASNPTRSLSVEQNGGQTQNDGTNLYQLYQQLLANGMSTEQAMQYLTGSSGNIRQIFA